MHSLLMELNLQLYCLFQRINDNNNRLSLICRLSMYCGQVGLFYFLKLRRDKCLSLLQEDLEVANQRYAKY